MGCVCTAGCAAQAPPRTAPRAENKAERIADDTILGTALVVAENVGIPRMRAEGNLTWQSSQLSALTRLFAKAGRYDEALQLLHDLDTPDRVKSEAFVPLAVAAIRAGDRPRAQMVLDRLLALAHEWTVPIALADIAVAMDEAGDRRGAARLLRKVDDPLARARALVRAKRPMAALRIAIDIAPVSMHIPSDEGPFWESDYSARQSFLLELVSAFVDGGDVSTAKMAMQAMDAVPDRSVNAFRARALIEIARRERPSASLREALQEIESEPHERMGDLSARVDVLATIAERSPSRPLALEALQKALAAIGQVDASGERAVHVLPFICDGLTRVARADFSLGRREEALELLDRSLQAAERIPVPPARKAGSDSSFDGPGSVLQDRCAVKAHVAAALDKAGEATKAGAALASALSELTAIPDAEWRRYAWEAIVKAYEETGQTDRAIEILAAHAASAQDMEYGLGELPESALLAAPRDRLWTLLQALPDASFKVGLLAQLAAHWETHGDREEAARCVAAAVAAIATRGEDWHLWLINLANELPSAGEPGYEEQLLPLRSATYTQK